MKDDSQRREPYGGMCDAGIDGVVVVASDLGGTRNSILSQPKGQGTSAEGVV